MSLIRTLGHERAWPTFHLKNELALYGVEVRSWPIMDHWYFSFPIGPDLECLDHFYMTPINHNNVREIRPKFKTK